MKITEIEKTDFIKIHRTSWTVKDSNTLKIKGLIRGIIPIMQLQPSKLFSMHRLLDDNGLKEHRGNIYTDGRNLYYPHNVTDFYEMQIKQFGHILIEEEYQRYLEYEKIVDELRKNPVLTVIDCHIL
jgi:hypothetical protein